MIWLLALGVIIIVVVIIFLWPAKSENESEVTSSIDDEAAPEVEAMERIESTSEEAGEAQLESIDLVSLVGDEYDGFARRGYQQDNFTHIVVASLPAIDLTTHFYEGWLIKPGVTEFFSTGEMFPRTDGRWGLVWENPASTGEFDDFSQVVITLEPRDDDPAPTVDHMLEGEF